MKDEQQFLIDNNCADLCLNNHKINNWTQRIYVSDIMEKYKRHILIHRTTENMWLRLSAFTQTLIRKASHILKRCVKICRLKENKR